MNRSRPERLQRSAEAMRPIDQGLDSIAMKSLASIGLIVPAGDELRG
jgi:hypothetical protein